MLLLRRHQAIRGRAESQDLVGTEIDARSLQRGLGRSHIGGSLILGRNGIVVVLLTHCARLTQKLSNTHILIVRQSFAGPILATHQSPSIKKEWYVTQGGTIHYSMHPESV